MNIMLCHPHADITTEEVGEGLYHDGGNDIHFGDVLDDYRRESIADTVPERCGDLRGFYHQYAAEDVQYYVNEGDKDISDHLFRGVLLVGVWVLCPAENRRERWLLYLVGDFPSDGLSGMLVDILADLYLAVDHITDTMQELQFIAMCLTLCHSTDGGGEGFYRLIQLLLFGLLFFLSHGYRS